MSTALQVHQEEITAPAPIAPEQDFDRLFRLSEALVLSGLMPKHVRTPAAAMAIILAGREMGIGPMLALRSLNMVEGKVTCAADLQLSRFKASGGRATFKQLDEKGAVLWLKHPNGDEHTESFTMEDARAAGLAGKDNWKKYPKAMLRSRVITAGLKSVGYEPTAGVYDPDELPAPAEPPTAAEPARAEREAPSANRRGDEAVERAARMTVEEAKAYPFPFQKNKPTYGRAMESFSTEHLISIATWIREQQQENGDDWHVDTLRAIRLILADRERNQTTLELGGDDAPKPRNAIAEGQ